MRPKSFYDREIQFTSQEEQKDFENEVYLETSLWKPSIGQVLGRGTFRTVRKAVLQHLETGQILPVIQKKVHHPMMKQYPLVEAFRWWKLQKIRAPVLPFYKIDPEDLEMYGTDLRAGYGHSPGPSQVFDTNASSDHLERLQRLFAEKPLKNPQAVVEQVRGIILLLDQHGISAHTDEVFLMVVQEREAVMQVLLGDLKMIDMAGVREDNAHSEKALLSFLSRFGVVA